MGGAVGFIKDGKLEMDIATHARGYQNKGANSNGRISRQQWRSIDAAIVIAHLYPHIVALFCGRSRFFANWPESNVRSRQAQI